MSEVRHVRPRRELTIFEDAQIMQYLLDNPEADVDDVRDRFERLFDARIHPVHVLQIMVMSL